MSPAWPSLDLPLQENRRTGGVVNPTELTELEAVRITIFSAIESAGSHYENSESAHLGYRQNRQKSLTRRELSAVIETSEDPAQVRDAFLALCLWSLSEIEAEVWVAQSMGALCVLSIEAGKWAGYIEMIRMLEDDVSLQRIRSFYHQSVAKDFRMTRDSVQTRKQVQALGNIKRRIAGNPGMSVLKAAKIEAEKTEIDKEKIRKKAGRLFLAFHEKTFDQAVDQADSEWASGETASHIEMSKYMLGSFFDWLKSEERELAKNELKRRLKELARDKYRERLFGSHGVRKDG